MLSKPGKKIYLVNVTHIGMEIWVLNQLLFCALEQAIVHKIEPNQSSKQTNIGQGESISTQISRTPQVNIQHVQRIKQLIHRFVVRFLALSKSASAQFNFSVTKSKWKVLFFRRFESQFKLFFFL